ncbi:hypothetical protein H6F67_00405 [Microcoleus sp. FACHB-1515]|uniref:hypothetical protein n=1 Tax=Cyanophyceae TaxID=3028117 RepID=UPI0016839ADA|nr:hypothetical protein [Microcoleus sp. FACHB-1515]MBD2088337.1 hypothetical protein [Microcoleus sp. FACHB-1515]
MFARSSPKNLTVIHRLSPKARIDRSRSYGFVVGKFETENQAKLEKLRQRRYWLTILSAGAVGAGGFAGFATLNPLLLAPVLTSLSLVGGDLQGTSQKFLLMSDLVEAFEEEDIAIEVGLKLDELPDIDFFLRFPDKEFVLIKIRSLSASTIFYSEEREVLRFVKKQRGIKSWQPDPLIEIAQQERWLRKHRPDLLGGSSRDKRRPLAKLLVLWTDTTLGEHPEHLYVTMDDQKFLTIRKMGTTTIVEKDQVVSFIRGYLASRRSQKTS